MHVIEEQIVVGHPAYWGQTRSHTDTLRKYLAENVYTTYAAYITHVYLYTHT
jgi:hypothetical protein